MTDFVIRQSDRYPVLNATLTYNDGTVINLTGATVKLLFMHASTGNTVAVDCTIVSATAGTVSYSWGAGDTIWPGSYTMVFLITFSNALTLSVPNETNLTLEITPAFIPTSGVVVNGNLVAYLGTTGTTFEDSGVAASDVLVVRKTLTNPTYYKNEAATPISVSGTANTVMLARLGKQATIYFLIGNDLSLASGETGVMAINIVLPSDFEPLVSNQFGLIPGSVNNGSLIEPWTCLVNTAASGPFGYPFLSITRDLPSINNFIKSFGYEGTAMPVTPDTIQFGGSFAYLLA